MATIRLDRLSVSNKTLIILTLFLSYFAKFVLYRYLVDLDKGLNAWQIIGAYVILVGVSMILACIGMRKAKIYASLFVMLIIDIWLIANIIYYKSNFFLLDWQVMIYANNLRGFEDSILVYLQWWYYLIPISTLLIAVFLVAYRKELKQEIIAVKKYLILLGSGLVIYLAGWGLGAIGNKVYAREHADEWMFNEDKMLFLKIHSPVGHLGMVTLDAIKDRILHWQAFKPLTAEEKAIIATIYTDSVAPAAEPQGHLVFILVESLESWPLTVHDQDGVEVCENINNYIRNHDLLLCTNLTSQQVYGRSGDGQLITQTGMLPLSSGVTCMSHGDNVYPNLAHFYPNGIVLNPYPGVWNQGVTTFSYGFKHLHEVSPFQRGTDSLMIAWAMEELQRATEPTCLLVLTLQTHAPFNSVEPTLRLEDNSPENKYLQTVHNLDKYLGDFFAWADTADCMKDATIVITADHNHFPVENGKGLCPLIIKSPNIERKTYIPQAYQMDVFPTVLHAIGQSNYQWQGFGIDLLAPDANRTISPKQAYALSDKMIRTNFFKETMIADVETVSVVPDMN